MPVTVHVTRQPADATQQGYLRSLFSSPGFSLLKEMVASRCVEKQASAMNAELYPDNPVAVENTDTYIKAAIRYSQALDVLLDLESCQPLEWWTAQLETQK